MAKLSSIKEYEAYKESGFEWIGNVPENWEITKLGACLSPVSIKNCAGLPLLSITRELGVIERNLQEQGSNHNFIPDDLSGYKKLVKGQFGMNKMKAWQGSYGVSKYTGIVSPAYYVFNFTKTINPEFFNWAIRSKLYVSYFGSASDGVRVGQWDLSKDRMKTIPFILPTENEQIAIAKFLDNKATQIDEAIAIKEKQIDLLKERKQIIIQQAVTQGLDPDVTMKHSGVDWIGEIPKHWNEVTKIKYISSLKGRQGWQGLKAEEYTDEGPHVLSSAHFNNYIIDWSKCPRVSYERYLMDTNIQLQIGDILLMKDGANMGKLAFVSDLPGPACLNSHLLLIRSLRDKQSGTTYFNSKYMFFHMMCAEFQDYVKINGTGATFLGISQESIGNYQLCLPPMDEQEIIVSFLEKETLLYDEAISQQERQIEKLKEYKTTLINSAVTGKIKVPGVV